MTHPPSADTIDSAALDAYLATVLPDYRGPLDMRAFANGQSNPTFLLSTPSGARVLRKQPPGKLLRSAHAIDREYRVQKALRHTDVPVADMLHYCDDASIIGTPFYVMEHVDGQLFWDPALPDLRPDQRATVYDEMNRVLAAIHKVDIEASELADYGKPQGYFERQLALWIRQYRASETDTLPEMDALIDWLQAHLPADDGRSALVHGDYRIDNLMFDRDRLRIVAVFDWELSTLGHPLADLAYQIMQRSMGRDWHLKGLAGLDLDTLGIPAEADYVQRWCDRTGIETLDNWPFAKVFAFFRFAAICQGVRKRALDGNAASPQASRVGAMAAPLAVLGWRLASAD